MACLAARTGCTALSHSPTKVKLQTYLSPSIRLYFGNPCLDSSDTGGCIYISRLSTRPRQINTKIMRRGLSYWKQQLRVCMRIAPWSVAHHARWILHSPGSFNLFVGRRRRTHGLIEMFLSLSYRIRSPVTPIEHAVPPPLSSLSGLTCSRLPMLSTLRFCYMLYLFDLPPLAYIPQVSRGSFAVRILISDSCLAICLFLSSSYLGLAGCQHMYF